MEYAKCIDHTILKPQATVRDVDNLCREAIECGFHSVCVNSSFVYYCAEKLKNTDVKVCTVVGFPLGAMSTDGKVAETLAAVQDGADEIDMVVHVGMVRSGNWDYVKEDIAAVVSAAGEGVTVKVILEMCLLTEAEKIHACEICKEAGADFVMTSTGYSVGGAVIEDVQLMRKVAGARMGVKAAGGIRTLEDVKAMTEAGADRIGTSASVTIAEEEKK